MVNSDAVIFEAMCRGVLNWHVCVNGVDDATPFANRDACIGAAMARARQHHQAYFVTTEVWAPGPFGKRECVISYMTPDDLDAALRTSEASVELRNACDQYGFGLPCR